LHWFRDSFLLDKPAAAQISPIQDKLDSLSQNEKAAPGKMQAQVLDSMAQPKAQQINRALSLVPVASTAVVDPSASPVASPGVAGDATAEKDKTKDKDKKDGDAKDGEKKDEQEAKAEGEGAAQGTPATELAQPYPVIPNPQPIANADSTPSSSPSALPADFGGVGPAGVPSSAANAESSGQVGGGTVESSSTSAAASTASSVSLSAADLVSLTAPMKGAFPDTQEPNISGELCPYGTVSAAPSNCTTAVNQSIYTARWSPTYGLSSTASFSIASGTSASQVKVNIGFNYQDTFGNTQTVSASVASSSISVQTEVKNGNQYKMYVIKLPNVSALNGESLSNVVATVIYQESSTGSNTSTLYSDSALTFTRTNAQTVASSDWTTGTNRSPAATDLVLIANSISYSMAISKSQ
jgi:hypothetical protein